MTYQGKAYTDGSALAYLDRSKERTYMNPVTEKQLRYILTMLRDQGEQVTFRYLREEVLKGKPFPGEENEKNS